MHNCAGGLWLPHEEEEVGSAGAGGGLREEWRHPASGNTFSWWVSRPAIHYVPPVGCGGGITEHHRVR